MESLAQTLSRIPGVVAVSLGGSRAQGTHRENSDWDFGVYYRGDLDPGDVRALGFEGEVFAPGDWAEPMHGGAWLRVDGVKVDLIYRDLALVETELSRAERGEFDIRRVPGYLVGMPTYALVGELALGRVLVGKLPRPTFPHVLRERAARRWTWEADFWMRTSDAHRERGDVVAVAGADAAAALSTAHAEAASHGRWVLNEKGLIAATDVPRSGGSDVAMEGGDVVAIMQRLHDGGVNAWVEGGWGIDALVGEQTRPHRDLDLAVDRGTIETARQILAGLGYRHDRDTRPGAPARYVLKDLDGRTIDLHPLLFDRRGNGWQQLSDSARRWGRYPADDLTARGEIAGHEVRCLSADLQLRFHLGYEWTERDRHDLRVMAERFGMEALPPPSGD